MIDSDECNEKTNLKQYDKKMYEPICGQSNDDKALLFANPRSIFYIMSMKNVDDRSKNHKKVYFGVIQKHPSLNFEFCMFFF